MSDKHDEMARELAKKLNIIAQHEARYFHGDKTDIAEFLASALRQVERETLERTTYLRPEVFAFAERMERKLRENDHKGGWKGCGPVYLMRRLREETGELDRATCGSYGIDAERVGDEAADVANFAMMIADNAGVLSPTPILIESANELPITQELADVSTPVKLIDRDQWQDIETAPKDGTEVLGWREDAGVMLIRYLAPIDFLTERELEKLDEESAETSDWFYADFVEGGRLEGRETPTHWMPQPTGPIQAAEKGE